MYTGPENPVKTTHNKNFFHLLAKNFRSDNY